MAKVILSTEKEKTFSVFSFLTVVCSDNSFHSFRLIPYDYGSLSCESCLSFFLLILFLYKFNAAVLGASLVGIVVGHRLMRTLAHGGEAVFSDAVLRQRGNDGLSTFLAERIIDGIGAGVITVSLHLELQGRIVLHDFGDTVDLAGGFGFEGGLAGVESDGVGHDLTVGGEAVIERYGTLGDADVLDEEDSFFLVAPNPEVIRLGCVGNVDDTGLVKINLIRPFVEGYGHMMQALVATPLRCVEPDLLSVLPGSGQL